jgi:hypothetical protein
MRLDGDSEDSLEKQHDEKDENNLEIWSKVSVASEFSI